MGWARRGFSLHHVPDTHGESRGQEGWVGWKSKRLQCPPGKPLRGGWAAWSQGYPLEESGIWQKWPDPSCPTMLTCWLGAAGQGVAVAWVLKGILKKADLELTAPRGPLSKGRLSSAPLWPLHYYDVWQLLKLQRFYVLTHVFLLVVAFKFQYWGLRVLANISLNLVCLLLCNWHLYPNLSAHLGYFHEMCGLKCVWESWLISVL